nr:acyl transferase/acyl hydrolase/lysophospholipase [Tanacetum cinerariifolium]
MTMHDAGTEISKAKPVEIGKFLLEDGKELTLSQKSSPGRNCIYPDQPCNGVPKYRLGTPPTAGSPTSEAPVENALFYKHVSSFTSVACT